jgi:hypothetical protein
MILSCNKMMSGIGMYTLVMRETIDFNGVSRQRRMHWHPFINCFFNRKCLDDIHLFS